MTETAWPTAVLRVRSWQTGARLIVIVAVAGAESDVPSSAT